MSRAICKQTAQKMELRRAVQACAVLDEQAHFQQWQGMQADKYAKWYCAEPFLRRALRSLQVIDYKGKNELRNCALLQVRKVVQFDTATFLPVVRCGAFPLVQTQTRNTP